MNISEEINKIQAFLEKEYESEILELNTDKNTLTIDFNLLSKHDPAITEELLDDTEETIKKIKIAIKRINNELEETTINIQFKNYSNAEELQRINILASKKTLVLDYTELYTSLARNERRKATELVVQSIKEQEHIHTTREEDNSQIWMYWNGIFVPQGRTLIKELCRQVFGKAYTTTLANEVIAKIEADTYIDKEVLFKNDNIELIAVENGLLNIKTKKLESFTPKKRFFTKIPIKYDSKAKCPNIIKHFKTILNNEEDLSVIQELFGFLLLRNYRYQKAFLFTGTGRNGKSITIIIIKTFLGAENCISVSLQQIEKDQFILSEFHNKLANLGADINNTALKETGIFKSLRGEDVITAPRKFLSPIHFKNNAKLIFCANEIPRTYDLSIAFFNSWIILDFPYTFLPEKEYKLLSKEEIKKRKVKLADPNIADKLTTEEELSGLLNWSLEGLARLQKENGFSYSKITSQVKELWIRRSDSFAAFLMDHVEEDYDGTITKDELRRAYSQYCREHKLVMSGDKHIKRLLIEQLGAWEDRENTGDRVMIWKGIKFKSVMDVKDVNSIYPYTKNPNFPIGQKTIDKSDSLDNEEEFIVEEQKIYHKCSCCGNEESNVFSQENGKPYCKNCYETLKTNGEIK